MVPADGLERRLDPRSIQAERLSGGISAAVLSATLLVGAVAIGALASPGLVGLLLLLAGWLLASAGLTVLLLAWPAISYRHTSYRISERGMRIRRGVFWRTVSSVPRSRVQHTDVSQGPIERMFGLATLIVYTAGTHHASVSLSGLARETALGIRDHLIAGGEDDAV
jgi:membrane protein YdbS with pleckstrin-like domain